MPNMKPEKTPMPAQNPIVRSGNFEEVEYGYTPLLQNFRCEQ